MTIRRFSCRQYAGVNDMDIRGLGPGMNVILGDNETGKTTFISGICDTLVTPAGVKPPNPLFPSDLGATNADGAVEVESAGFVYEISKHWQTDGKGRPDDIHNLTTGKYLSDADGELLGQIIGCNGAVCSNVIFARQNNDDEVIDWFSRFVSGQGYGNAVKRDKLNTDRMIEARNVVIRGALSISDGISPEHFLQILGSEIETLSKGWDIERNRPARVNSRCRLVSDYNALLEARKLEADYEAASAGIDAADAQIAALRDEASKLSARSKELASMQGAAAKSELRRRREEELSKRQEDAVRWQSLEDSLPKLRTLEREKADEDRYRRKKEITDTLADIASIDSKLRAVTDIVNSLGDIETDLQTYIDANNEGKAASQLLGGKLRAQVEIMGNAPVFLSSSGNKALPISETSDMVVTGYARVEIPDVARITVSPVGVDVDEQQGIIDTARARMRAVLNRYSVSSYEELVTLKKRYRDAQADRAKLELRKEARLAGTTVERLQQESDSLGEDGFIVPDSDLDTQIAQAIGDSPDIGTHIRLVVIKGIEDIKLGAYHSAYETPGDLKAANEELAEALRQEADRSGETDAICTLAEIEKEQKRIDARQESISQELSDLSKRLGGYYEQQAAVECPQDSRSQALEETMRADLARLHNLLEIKRDFERLQAHGDNDMGAFIKALDNNLQLICGTDALHIALGGQSVVITSKSNSFTGGTNGQAAFTGLLSSGTKQAVLLAFRLALLSYYYKDGGAVVVLDDVLLDMDPARRDRAAALLKDFASKGNQVIFTTCDPQMVQILLEPGVSPIVLHSGD